MTKGHPQAKNGTSRERVGRNASTGRFVTAKAEPVTKRGTITLRQAEKAVRDYLATHPR